MSDPGRDPEGVTERFVALGLERDPFPDNDLHLDFFAGGSRERQMDALTDLWGLGRPLVLVTGPDGVGRSTFFQVLQRRLPDDARVARVTAGVFLSSRNLLRAVARAMGIAVDAEENREGIRERLYQQIMELGQSRTLCAVLVDDADELEAEAFDELVGLAELHANAPNVRVLLFGSERLRRAVADVVGEARMEPLVLEVPLEPYTLNELRRYLQFRLERAGLSGNPPFSERDYQEIYVASRGLPRDANAVARRILLERGRRWTRQHMMLAGGVAALLLMALLALLLDPQPAPETVATAPPERGNDRPPPTVDVTRQAREAQSGDPAEDVRDRGWLPLPDPPAAGDAVDRVAEAPPTEASPTEAPPAMAPPAEASPAEASPTEASPAEASPAEAPPAEAPPAEAPPAEASPAMAPPAEAPPTETPSHPLLERSPDRYMLQIFVLSSRERAQDWIDAQAAGDYFVYTRIRNGARQYVVVQGDYPDRDAARSAVADVAAATGQSPFLREMRSIQDELVE